MSDHRRSAFCSTDENVQSQQAGALAATAGRAAHVGATGQGLSGREILFIDAALHDWAKIAANVRTDVDVVVLDTQADPLAQIVDTFACGIPPEAVHIAARGDYTHLQLGERRICLAQLPGQATPLAELQGSLLYVDDAVLYGCEFAHSSQTEHFLHALLQASRNPLPAASALYFPC
ncbi:MAG TPA: DUF4347 domain-containing protein [Pusillimonas sp.]|uniref:DUF4347 domain-containing protein n=1 Tax=Pusillimonas sp. TaxID=3040095 RepID=UPI002CD339DC|nr:DUF4347 domain-containing protein [Pusillimonas sp.]HUH86828.1 DUF4347 domain-containing protein [Pusillimonas sp.]